MRLSRVVRAAPLLLLLLTPTCLCGLHGYFSQINHPQPPIPSSSVSYSRALVNIENTAAAAATISYPSSPTHIHYHHHRNLPPPPPSPKGQFHEIYGWSQFDFAYPTPAMRQQAILSGTFEPSSVVAIGVAGAGPRVFLAMPRWRNGVPAVLATVPYPANSSSPLLEPYPSWSWHQQGNCEGITSTYRVKVDECGRLWVLDTGAVNTWENPRQICPAAIHVFDLKTDQRILRYRFPQDVLKPDTLLVSLEVEYPNDFCGGTHGASGATVYSADVTTYAVIVTDLRAHESWRVQDKTMYPSPEAGTFTINGESFELMDGVIGLALSPIHTQPKRTLFFHSMAGFRHRWVRTSVLRNQTAANNSPQEFHSAANTRPSQVAACGMDQNGVMFFGMLSSNSLHCWNTRKPFDPTNVVTLAKDDRTLQFVTTTTVDPASKVWALSTRLQSFVLGTLDSKQINYRIHMAPSSVALVRGTECDLHGPSSSSSDHIRENHLVFPHP